MKQLQIIICLLFGMLSQAQNSEKNLTDYSKMNTLNIKSEGRALTKINDSVFEVVTETQPRFIYNYATSIPLHTANYSKDRVFLLSFDAKTVTSSLETGEAKILWLFKQSDSYQHNLEATISVSSDWQTYYIPFQSNKSISKNDLAIVMQYGFSPQSFLIKDLKFEVFPEGTDMTTLPKTKITYAGMEPDAKWRKEANERIESLRKGDFSIQFTKDGKPLENTAVNIKLVKHHFNFGARIHAEDIVNDADDYKNFKKGFNSAVLGNDLKIKRWDDKNRDQTLKALDILKQDGIDVKGHVLIWPGFNYLTSDIKKNKNNPAKVTNIIESHVNDILDATKGKVSHWDVVNEAYTNKDLQNITGSEEILYNGFRTLREKQPDVRRFVNEYGIISKGGLDTQKQQWYYEFIKRIDAHTDNAVQGIGIQSHMGSDLTSPQRVLELLSYYATLGKAISISEFTMDVQDPDIREQYTRDFMIAAFSQPNVTEFLFWGNTEDGRNKVDIFNTDNSVGVMGKAYFSLVEDAWKTNLSGNTTADGIVSGRGFYGTYEYSFVQNGIVMTGTFDLKPRSVSTFKIDL